MFADNEQLKHTIDLAFAHRLGVHFSENKGRLLENLVYLELLRRRKEVYYYAGKNECDFLVKEGLNIAQAIQVVYQLDASNREREFLGLQEAMQTYNIKQGLLITFQIDQTVHTSDEQIQVIPIWKWLLNGR